MNDDCGCTDGCCDTRPGLTSLARMDRRAFVKTAAAGGASLAFGAAPIAGPFVRRQGDHFVPADKKLSPDWVDALFARGASAWYAGGDLETIGMPVGGLCAGQLYLTGDGRLVDWDIFNQNRNTGAGAVNYRVGRPPEETVTGGRLEPAPEVGQGFAIRVVSGERTIDRTLDRNGFPAVRFNGEYPIARVEYWDPASPVTVHLEAFSPFIPLDTEDSTLPVTILRFVLRNTSARAAEVTLAGWIENGVCLHSGASFADRFVRRNAPLRTDALTGVLSSARILDVPVPAGRDPVVFADFEGGDYGAWTVDGEAFGARPARGTLPEQNPVSGFAGRGLVNTFLGGDEPTGTLRSPEFTIDRPWIAFLIGGGNQPERTCMNLVMDGAVVRTATGRNNERLLPHNWNVEELAGRTAHIEIVDDASGGWGHVNIDRIEFRDSPMVADPGPVELWTDYGTLCLGLVGDGFAHPSITGASVFDATPDAAEKPAGETLRGAAGRTMTLQPGSEEEAVFVVAWHMPNMYRDDKRVGNRYATRFGNAGDVAGYVSRNLDRLTRQTRLWHDTYYDSTLPYWLLDRLHSTVANLATTTAQWWENGRFWGWEGAACCRGTCGHVWNYEHAMARLFPDLERSVREMQDFAPGVGFYPDTGAIGFRGEGWTLWAGDAQGGYILKALREHQTSTDDAFLRRNWPNIRKAVEFLIEQDGNDDGLIEGAQHQTYDENYYGPNTMVGSLYLGALRAAEVMATEMGDADFAARCRRIFEAGRDRSVELLFNGEYFVQKVDLEQHPDWQYGDGCLADQMFGQGWAHQVGLGYLYPVDTVRATLGSIWKYCWAPDIGPQNEAHAPERWFAYPGEAGLFTCTWPKSPHMGPRSTRYRNEIWTGIEYQVAGHMAWEGMTTEALAICRAIHERYHPARHNPWNEIECGDHYARAMASWGVYTALAGFEHDGPAAHIGFAPRLTPENSRAAFTAAGGWGSYRQTRSDATQTCEIEVRHGNVRADTVAFAVASDFDVANLRATIDGAGVQTTWERAGTRVSVTLPAGTTVPAGSTLRVSINA